MSEHSKTPWRVFTTRDGTKLVGIGTQEGEGILDCGFGVWSWNDPEGIANANMVVKAVNSHDALSTVEEAARNYFMYAVQDEANERECCVDDEQHRRAIALRDALASIKEPA